MAMIRSNGREVVVNPAQVAAIWSVPQQAGIPISRIELSSGNYIDVRGALYNIVEEFVFAHTDCWLYNAWEYHKNNADEIIIEDAG